MAPPVKSTKTATRGAKQIVEENEATLSFYRSMVIIAVTINFALTMLLFEFTTLTITLTIFSGMVYTAAYQFMCYMAKAKYTESGQIIDSGIDLNMEGSIAEHIKDLIILTAGCQVLSLISNYFWLLWLLAPLRGVYMLWVNILAPWFFAQPEQTDNEKDEKKQRKLERKMARRH